MRIVARGWKRDCGANEILNIELGDGYCDPSADAQYIGGRVYLKSKANGDVELLSGPHLFTLGGKYQTIVTVTKSDILCLFAEAFKDEPLIPTINKLAVISKTARA